MPRKPTPAGATRADLLKLRRELANVRDIMKANADTLRTVRQDCAANLRRCGELQRDVDELRKLLRARVSDARRLQSD